MINFSSPITFHHPIYHVMFQQGTVKVVVIVVHIFFYFTCVLHYINKSTHYRLVGMENVILVERYQYNQTRNFGRSSLGRTTRNWMINAIVRKGFIFRFYLLFILSVSKCSLVLDLQTLHQYLSTCSRQIPLKIIMCKNSCMFETPGRKPLQNIQL